MNLDNRQARFDYLDVAKTLEDEAHAHMEAARFHGVFGVMVIAAFIAGSVWSGWSWFAATVALACVGLCAVKSYRYHKAHLRQRELLRETMLWYYTVLGEPKKAEKFQPDQ